MEPSERLRKLVVAGLVISPDRRMLLAKRRADQAMGLQWEFPGGKIEAGESPEQALVTELGEELDARVEVGPIWEVLFHCYADFDLLMLVYQCRLEAGQEPRCREVADIAWCTVEQLGDYDILPADQSMVQRLQAEGVPSWRRPGRG